MLIKSVTLIINNQKWNIMSNNAGNTLLALLTGAAIGAGIGILFAPDKGTRTREKFKDGYDDAIKDLKHKFENASDELKSKLAHIRNQIFIRFLKLFFFVVSKFTFQLIRCVFKFMF